MKLPRWPFKRRQLSVEFEVIDTKGQRHSLWLAGKDSTLTLPQPVRFTDDATGVVYQTTVTWQLRVRGVKRT